MPTVVKEQGNRQAEGGFALATAHGRATQHPMAHFPGCVPPRAITSAAHWHPTSPTSSPLADVSPPSPR